MNDRAATTFIFLPFRLDPARRLLTRDSRPIALKPKEFDTLLVLVEEDGRVVDKDELVARVWLDSYVGDGSLARNISVLRKALGEDVIETHRGRGYRITLPIAAAPASPTPEAVPIYDAAPPPLAGTRPASRPWIRRSIMFASAATTVLIILLIAVRLFAIKTAKAHPNDPSIQSILIEKSGGLDPLDEGFKLARPDGDYVHAHLMRNAENNGFDRWRLLTRDQNYYYRALSDAEKQFLVRHDWTLTCICALERGAGALDVDLGPGVGPRFDITYLQEGSKYYVALTKRISPQYEFEEKVEFPGVGDVDHPHTYELRYDHVTQTASLWIDGQRGASGYRGHHQFQENRGLMLSAATYRDVKEASIVFRSVRLEAF